MYVANGYCSPQAHDVRVACQVGIAKEKVVNIGRLSEVAAAELFVASASREVQSPSLAALLYVWSPVR